MKFWLKLLCCVCGAALLCACAQGAGQSAPQTASEETDGGPQVVNPIKSVASPEAFVPLGLVLEAPENATDVSYSTIDGTTAQANFALEGASYTLRGAYNSEWKTLAGVYEAFEQSDETVQPPEGSANTAAQLQIAQGGIVAWWQNGDATFTLWAPEGEQDAVVTVCEQLLAVTGCTEAA